jgi:hypothetical protein
MRPTILLGMHQEIEVIVNMLDPDHTLSSGSNGIIFLIA